MREEGDLFYWYVILCVCMLAFNAFLLILVGACFFTGGSFFGTKIVEQMVEKVDEIPQQMAEKAAARKRGDDDYKKPEEDMENKMEEEKKDEPM